MSKTTEQDQGYESMIEVFMRQSEEKKNKLFLADEAEIFLFFLKRNVHITNRQFFCLKLK